MSDGDEPAAMAATPRTERAPARVQVVALLRAERNVDRFGYEDTVLAAGERVAPPDELGVGEDEVGAGFVLAVHHGLNVIGEKGIVVVEPPDERRLHAPQRGVTGCGSALPIRIQLDDDLVRRLRLSADGCDRPGE